MEWGRGGGVCVYQMMYCQSQPHSRFSHTINGRSCCCWFNTNKGHVIIDEGPFVALVEHVELKAIPKGKGEIKGLILIMSAYCVCIKCSSGQSN